MEIKREPILTFDKDGDKVWTFDAQHTWSDVARWIARNPDDAEDMIFLLRKELRLRTDQT